MLHSLQPILPLSAVIVSSPFPVARIVDEDDSE